MKSLTLPNNLSKSWTLSQSDETLKGLQAKYQIFSKLIFNLSCGQLQKHEILEVNVEQVQQIGKNIDQNKINPNLALIQGNTQKDDVQQQMYNVLKLWFLENLENPYPSQKIRSDMVLQTGLTHNQVVSIWFNNTRQRYLDPLKKKSTFKEKKFLSKRKGNLQIAVNDQEQKIQFSQKIENEIVQKDNYTKNEYKIEENDIVMAKTLSPSLQFEENGLIKQNKSLPDLPLLHNQSQTTAQQYYQSMILLDPYSQQQAQIKAQQSILQEKQTYWMLHQQQQFLAQVQYFEYIKKFQQNKFN